MSEIDDEVDLRCPNFECLLSFLSLSDSQAAATSIRVPEISSCEAAFIACELAG